METYNKYSSYYNEVLRFSQALGLLVRFRIINIAFLKYDGKINYYQTDVGTYLTYLTYDTVQVLTYALWNSDNYTINTKEKLSCASKVFFVMLYIYKLETTHAGVASF